MFAHNLAFMEASISIINTFRGSLHSMHSNNSSVLRTRGLSIQLLAFAFVVAKKEQKMSFFSSSKPAKGSPAAKSDADEIVNGIREEMSQQAVQDLFQRVAEKCFAKCITKPGSKLEENDRACLARCEDRFLEVMNTVSQALQDRSAAVCFSFSLFLLLYVQHVANLWF